MNGIIRNGLQTYEILESYKQGRIGNEKEFRKFSDFSSALNFLRGFLFDSNSMNTVRGFHTGTSMNRRTFGLDDQELLERMAWKLVSGRLKVLELPRSIAANGGVGGSAQAGKSGKEHAKQKNSGDEESIRPVPAEIPEPDHWVKVRIVYDDTDEPAEGMYLKIKLPTGQVREFRSDGNGEISIESLPSNNWEIVELIESEGLEVVSFS